MVPSVHRAKEQAKLSVCAIQLKSASNLMANYVFNNKDYIPGTNTSGVAVRTLLGSPISSYQKSSLPIQPQDWITPIIRDDIQLPNSRAKKLDIVNRQFQCPSLASNGETIKLYGEPNDLPEFATHLSTGSSYLMPSFFQYWGQNRFNDLIATNAHAQVGSDRWEVIVNHYQSKINQIGTPANKIMAADGARLVNQSSIQAEDIRNLPTLYGSFASAGAWLSESNEYGARDDSNNWNGTTIVDGSMSQGGNLRYSYRHKSKNHSLDAQGNNGKINALFFDGHVESLNDFQSRKIDYWYPKGGIINQRDYFDGIGMTNVDDEHVIN